MCLNKILGDRNSTHYTLEYSIQNGELASARCISLWARCQHPESFLKSLDSICGVLEISISFFFKIFSETSTEIQRILFLLEFRQYRDKTVKQNYSFCRLAKLLIDKH